MTVFLRYRKPKLVGMFIAEYNNIQFFKMQKQISELWSYAYI